ncbi:histidinol-phosphate transaminase [Desulfovibrio sp. OttesenSCG-928-O18]|nr:histidinol-phosphate transaminase [Desulfovibrio sp. OttesenSCG-928-O18]
MTPSFTDVRSEIYDFTPYSPGLSIDEIRERYGLPQVVKLASNENPLGTSPQVIKAIQKAAPLAFRYPQSGEPRLSSAIAKFHNVPVEQVVPGNGSDEIIDLLIRIRAVPGEHNVVTCDPCFSIYPLQTRLAGVALRQAPLKPDFSFDWETLLALVDDNTALVFLTTPDNPSGYCPKREDILAFAQKLPPFTLLVIDEAYMDFVEDQAATSVLCMEKRPANIAVIRTFSKSFGLAGMRVGYGILPPELTGYMRRVRLPFSVNILAEEAAIAAIEDEVFRSESIRVVHEGRKWLADELSALGCVVHPSQSNFLMFSLPPNRGYSARNVFEALLTRGVIIRPLQSYKLPDHLRITVGSSMENKIFIAALANLLDATVR